MNVDLLVSRGQLVAMALVVATILQLSNCGGGDGEASSDIAASSLSARADTNSALLLAQARQPDAFAEGAA